MQFDAVKTETIFVAQTTISQNMSDLFESVQWVGDEKYIKGKIGDVYIQIYAPNDVNVDTDVIVRLEQKIAPDFTHKRIIISTIAHKTIIFPELARVPILPYIIHEGILAFIG